jgi:hypothetical protein
LVTCTHCGATSELATDEADVAALRARLEDAEEHIVDRANAIVEEIEADAPRRSGVGWPPRREMHQREGLASTDGLRSSDSAIGSLR